MIIFETMFWKQNNGGTELSRNNMKQQQITNPILCCRLFHHGELNISLRLQVYYCLEMR